MLKELQQTPFTFGISHSFYLFLALMLSTLTVNLVLRYVYVHHLMPTSIYIMDMSGLKGSLFGPYLPISRDYNLTKQEILTKEKPNNNPLKTRFFIQFSHLRRALLLVNHF